MKMLISVCVKYIFTKRNSMGFNMRIRYFFFFWNCSYDCGLLAKFICSVG